MDVVLAVDVIKIEIVFVVEPVTVSNLVIRKEVVVLVLKISINIEVVSIVKAFYSTAAVIF